MKISDSSCQAYAKMERKLGNLVASQRLLRKALRIDPENAAALMVKFSPTVNQVSIKFCTNLEIDLEIFSEGYIHFSN